MHLFVSPTFPPPPPPRPERKTRRRCNFVRCLIWGLLNSFLSVETDGWKISKERKKKKKQTMMQENAWFTSEIRSFFLTARISKSREAKRKNKKKDRYIHLPTRRSSSTQVFAFKVFRSIRNFYQFFKLKGSIARNLYIRMDESRPDFAKKSLQKKFTLLF